MAELEKLTVALEAETAGFTAAMQNVQGTIGKLGKGFAAAAVAAAGVGAAIGAAGVAFSGLAEATRLAADFEQSIANAASKTSQFGAAQQQFAQAAIEAGLATAFSAQQAADGLDILATAGLGIREATAALPGVLQLAQAGMLSIAEAADISAVAMRGYGFAATELGFVNDVLVKAFTSANQTASELGQALRKAGPIAKVLNQDFRTTVATLSVLADAGFKAEEGGTALKVAFARLAKPTKQVSEALARLGVRTKGSDGRMRDFIEIMGALEKAGADAGDFVEIFGQRSGPTLAALLVKGVDGLKKLKGELVEAGGAAREMEKRQLSTLGSQFKIFKGTIETVAIAFGQTLSPIVREVVKVLQRMTQTSFKSGKALNTFRNITISGAEATISFLKTIEAVSPAVLGLAGSFRIMFNVTSILAKTVIAFGRVLVGLVTGPIGLIVTGLGTMIEAGAQAAAALGQKGLAAQLDAAGKQVTGLGLDIVNLAGEFLDLDESTKSIADDLMDVDEVFSSLDDQIAAVSGTTSTLTGALEKGVTELKNVDNSAFLTSVAMAKLGDQTDKTNKKTNKLAKDLPKLDPILNKLASEFGTFDDVLERAEKQERALAKELDRLGLAIFKEETAAIERETKAIDEARLRNREIAMREFQKGREQVEGFRGVVTDGLAGLGTAIGNALGASAVVDAASSIIGGAIQGAAVGGPAGALAGGLLAAGTSLVTLAAETKAFQRITTRVGSAFEETFGNFDDFGDRLAAAAGPTAELLAALVESFEPLTKLFGGDVFQVIARDLFAATRFLAKILLEVGENLVKLVRGITFLPALLTDVFASLVETINEVAEFFGIDALAGVAADLRATSDRFNKFREGLETLDDTIDAAQDRIDKMTFREANRRARQRAQAADGIIALGAAMQESFVGLADVGSNLKKLNDEISRSLTNVPSGVKLALAAFRATAGFGAPQPASVGMATGFFGMQAPSGGATGIMIENLFIQGSSVSDLESLEQSIIDDGAWDRFRSTGSVPTFARYLGREIGS